MDRRSIERWLKRLACAAFAVALAVGFADADFAQGRDKVFNQDNWLVIAGCPA